MLPKMGVSRRIKQFFTGKDHISGDLASTPSSKCNPPAKSNIARQDVIYCRFSFETDTQYRLRKQDLATITRLTTPSAEWTRSHCVVWIYRHLVDGLRMKKPRAVDVANGFHHNGAWMFTMSKRDWEGLVGSHSATSLWSIVALAKTREKKPSLQCVQ